MLLPNRGKASVLFDESLGKHRTDRVKLRNCVFNLRFTYDYKRITGNIDILIPIFRAFYCFSILQCYNKSSALSLPNTVANES